MNMSQEWCRYNLRRQALVWALHQSVQEITVCAVPNEQAESMIVHIITEEMRDIFR